MPDSTSNTQSKKIWVLTRFINEYYQEGGYFVAAFAAKPTHEQLAQQMSLMTRASQSTLFKVLAKLEHVLNGGSRQNNEHEWYELKQEDLL